MYYMYMCTVCVRWYVSRMVRPFTCGYVRTPAHLTLLHPTQTTYGTSNAMVIIQLSMYICSIPNGCSEYAYVQYKIYACCICIYVRREEVERVCLCICPSVCVRVSKSTLIWSIGMIQCFAPDPCWVIWVCVVRMSVRTLGVDCGRVFQVAMC